MRRRREIVDESPPIVRELMELVGESGMMDKQVFLTAGIGSSQLLKMRRGRDVRASTLEATGSAIGYKLTWERVDDSRVG